VAAALAPAAEALPALLPAAEDSQQLLLGGVEGSNYHHHQQQQQQAGEVGLTLEQQQQADADADAAAAAASGVCEDPAAAFAADLPGSQAEEAFYVYPAEVPDEVRGREGGKGRGGGYTVRGAG
jgi:hypothetical protein